ncbi:MULTISPECIES: hypothetical protein [Microbacterium]|uniref:hypothetical protein n=1 Tax=Microbacterium TaxID=33882 RepID=UPI002784E8DD|nr:MULTISPECIES: hypothetical protein [Microbacterium]MDQ1084424.1 hypothetical protein [Microbacterium sp. SORGH_AS_0344]MDQ1170301.1 hypothetical protein [Microbacterium proteolyticum]
MTSPSAPNGPVFAAPHVAPPVGTLLTPPPPHRRRRPLGVWALVLSVVATVLTSAIGGFAAFRTARGAGPGLETLPSGALDWRVLSPVREVVLVGETAFWAGTVIGVTALVLGTMAAVLRSARGAGIAAIVVAALGPAVFGGLVAVGLVAGLATMSGGTTAV